MERQPWLSASQMQMFLRCPRQYYFRYIERLKIPPSGAMKQGSVFHLAAGYNYTQKVTSRVDLPENDLTEYFADQFETEFAREEVKFQEGESKGALKDQGIDLVKTFAVGIAPHVQPVEVESKFELNIGKGEENVKLIGYIDVVDEHGIIRDNKTMTPQGVPNADNLGKDVQLSTYSLARRLITKKAEPLLTLDAVIKYGRWPEARILPTARSREGLKMHLNTIGHIGKAIRAEAFPMNTNGWHCSRKWCGYFDRCAGKGLVTVDLSANLEQLLRESVGEKEEGREGRQESREEATEASQEGSQAGQEGPDDAA